MKQLCKQVMDTKQRDIRAIQFGEGNFLRAFVDYMIDIANEKEITDIGVAIIKPIAFGNLDSFNEQDNLFTVMLRGIENGKTVEDSRVVTCVQQIVDAVSSFNDVLELATLDTLQFAFSNTTEAGIVFSDQDSFEANPPSTFPAKLTLILHKRYTHFNGAADKGLIIVPCELIDRNGDNLKKCVMEYIKLWKLGDAFEKWVLNSCTFCNTLVDRIVTGYPHNDAERIFTQLGYTDKLLDTAEPFGFWVIESERDISSELPLDRAGLPVVFTDDITPYRERKVRILNGAHTTMVLAAHLAGETIVRDCMHDSVIRAFIERTVYSEIMPTLTLPKSELEAFSASVMERFENPFIDHALLAISLNSVSKWKARVLPTMKDSIKSNGKNPQCIAFSLAALIAFYSTGTEIQDGKLIGHANGSDYPIIDDGEVLEFFSKNAKLPINELTANVLGNEAFWGEDLTLYTGLSAQVAEYVTMIRTDAKAAIKSVCEVL